MKQQQEMPLIGECPGPIDLPVQLIQSCDTKEDAIQLCWMMRPRNAKTGKKMSIDEAAKHLGLSRPQLSKILSSDSGMRGNQERALQYLYRNRAITQWQAWELGCQLVDETWEGWQRNHGMRDAA